MRRIVLLISFVQLKKKGEDYFFAVRQLDRVSNGALHATYATIAGKVAKRHCNFFFQVLRRFMHVIKTALYNTLAHTQARKHRHAYIYTHIRGGGLGATHTCK